jgi:2-aminoadipate transaminase
MVAYEVARGGFLDRHIWHIRRVYGERRDIMLESMEKYFPASCTWTHPQGGLFLWGIMPEYLDATEVFKFAVQKKVAFVPGQSFFARGGGLNTMRLNFSNASPEMIRTGIARLGETLYELIEAHEPV